MKTAAIQIHSTHNKSENIRKAKSLVEEAARNGAQTIVLPEVFTFRGMIRPEKGTALSKTFFMDQIADEIPGATIAEFQTLASKHKIFILAGSVYGRSCDPDRAYNASVLIADDGNILQTYHKIHLFNAQVGDKKYCESDYFLCGKDLQIARVGDFTVGMSVCYDIRFPEMYRDYRQKGVDLFVIPSAFTQTTGEAHWHALVRARAIENLSYVLAPNQTGEDNMGRRCFGHSLIVDPWGEILAEASGDREEIIYADVSKDAIKERRKTLGHIG